MNRPPGRNDPCFCGSGKKYKKCCLRKAGLQNRGPLVPSSEKLKQLDELYFSNRFDALENYAYSLLEQYPNAGTVWKLYALSLLMQGKDALSAMQKAADLSPRDAEAQGNLASLLHSLGQFEQAVNFGRKAIKIRPDFAAGHNNLGVALKSLSRFEDARVCFQNALRLNPVFAEAHNNLGSVLMALGQMQAAVSSFQRAVRAKPDFVEAQSNLLFSLNYENRISTSDRLDHALQYGQMVRKLAAIRMSDWLVEPRPERLRVGLVSGDFRDHVVSYFLESVLAHIEPAEIELIAYPTHRKEDDFTARIRPAFAQWKPIVGLNDEVAARSIREDRVHILIDLAGHSAENRLPVFAWKPAPVQVSWLGYFATTGLEEIDYLLADEVGVPAHLHAQFTESIWYLPDTRLCFTPPRQAPEVSELPALSNGKTTFGCFQNLTKLSDDVLAAWGKIFAALPDAALRIQSKQLNERSQQERITRRLEKHGIAAERLVLCKPVHRRDYLACHAEVDLILDTFPYPGGATTCEALWMGVPTVTLAGDSLLARQGASLVTAAGLSNWVAEDVDDYVSKAISLAADHARLAELRANLRDRLMTKPLFDARRFAVNLQTAFREMWQSHLDAC